MHKEQAFPTNLNEFYRCGVQIRLQTDNFKNHSPIEKMDATIEENINITLWKDDVLRVTERNEIDIHVKNGVVYMSGHLIGSTNRQRVEKALESVEVFMASEVTL